MNKPISSLFVFSVVYCVVFRQKLKNTRRKQKQKETENKQNNSKKNIKNRNTGYPALDPTANKYLSGSGWEIYVFFSFF